MPELPEVETLRRELARVLVGKKILGANVLNSPRPGGARSPVAPLSSSAFSKRLAGQKIKSVERRAKMLIIDLVSKNSLVFHLKMTGQLIYQPKHGKLIIGGHPEDPEKYTRIIFKLSGGNKLLFNDLRKFGWARLVDDRGVADLVGKVGVEPLSREFTTYKLTNLLTKYPNRTIKQVLLDQSLIAGLGNIYADESCFLTGIRPNRRVQSLISPRHGGARKAISKLHQSIIKVLKLSISKKGTSSQNYVRSDGSRGGFVPYLNVYGRAGEPCKVCGRPIKKIRHAGRGTHFCPYCQK